MTPLRATGFARRAAGLTLVESLAAVALLASIAGACALACRDLRATSDRMQSHNAIPGLSNLVADGLVEDPPRLGIPSLAALSATPKPLTLDQGLADALSEIRTHAGLDHASQAQSDARAWRVPAHLSRSTRPAGAYSSPHRGPTPHWLLVEVGGDVAIRCILATEEDTR